MLKLKDGSKRMKVCINHSMGMSLIIYPFNSMTESLVAPKSAIVFAFLCLINNWMSRGVCSPTRDE